MNLYNLGKQWQARSSRKWTHKTASCAFAFVAMACLAYPAWRSLAAGGDLDTSFSGDGRYSLPFVYPEYASNVDEVLIQTDPNNIQVERVIAAYSNRDAYDKSYDFRVTRLTQSGTKDSTFGNNGDAKINFDSTGLPTSFGTVKALALQSNGKILVAGNLSTGGGNGYVAALARLTVDGDLDTSFSGDGLWLFFGGSEVSDMVVQSDGKILLAGRMKDSTSTYWKSALWRFNSNGTTDASFGTLNGAMSTTVWSGSSTDGGVREGFKSVYVQADDKIVVLNNNGSGYRLRRYEVTAFGVLLDWSLQVNAAAGDKGNSIRPVGTNIWVIGSTGQYGAIFARNSANSLSDVSFGNNGKVVSSQPSVWMDSAPVLFSYPARYVIVGWNRYSLTFYGWPDKAVVTQYFSSGAPNLNFGNNGSVETTGFKNYVTGATYGNSRYSSVRVGLSGKIVAGGQMTDITYPVPPEFGAVARYWGN